MQPLNAGNKVKVKVKVKTEMTPNHEMTAQRFQNHGGKVLTLPHLILAIVVLATLLLRSSRTMVPGNRWNPHGSCVFCVHVALGGLQ